MGVVFLPELVTGFSAMSRRQMMTFMEGRQFRENSSQRDGSCGPACRFILMRTFFVSAIRLYKPPFSTAETFLVTTHLEMTILIGGHLAASYLRARGLIKEMSTGSYASCTSQLTHLAHVVLSQLASSRSGN